MTDTQPEGLDMTDEQIIERCAAAGIKWIPPELPDDCDYEMGFPGSFDMVSMSEMRALLSASKPAAPIGWKLVPVEPTVEMLNAALEHDSTFGHGFKRRIYQEMLAATPAALAQSAEPVAWALKIAPHGNFDLTDAQYHPTDKQIAWAHANGHKYVPLTAAQYAMLQEILK